MQCPNCNHDPDDDEVDGYDVIFGILFGLAVFMIFSSIVPN